MLLERVSLCPLEERCPAEVPDQARSLSPCYIRPDHYLHENRTVRTRGTERLLRAPRPFLLKPSDPGPACFVFPWST